MRTHGRLVYHANPAAESGFREGRTEATWAVQATPDAVIRLKRLFPRCDPYRNGWIGIVDTAEVARDLQWFVQRYPLDADPATWARLRERADEHRHTERVVYDILTGHRPHLEFDLVPIRPGRDYQLVAADLTIETGRLLLTDELGLGKTMSGLLVLRALDALPALVVCQTHLPAQWERELADTFPGLRAHTVRKMEPYDPGSHRSMRGYTPDVLIVPYSKLRGWGAHLAGRVRTVIFDEVQELRLMGSQKWMAAATVADGANYRIGLSATPVYNYAGELHTIFEVLAPGELGGRDEFVREWGGQVRHTISGTHVTVKDPAALGMHLRHEGLMLRRTRKEVGRELPDVVRVPHSIDSDTDLLDTLIDDATALAEIIVAREARQTDLFTARGEFDWKMRRATGIAKAHHVAAFVDLLIESGEKVILWGWHRTVYDIWLDRLKAHEPVMYTGSESPAAKRRAVDAFTSSEHCRLLIMSLRSGSGIDGLQEVCHVGVFGELDWSPGMHEQCIGRLRRDTNHDPEPVVAYFLVSDHGSDPLMAEVLNLKRMQAEPIQNPDTPLIQPVADVGDRLARLAEQVLEARSRRRRDPRNT